MPENVTEIFDLLNDLHRKYGHDVTMIGAFNDLVLDISSTQNVEKVLLAKTTKKSFPYEFLEPWLGTGLLLSFGEKWFQRRRIITPAFHFKILDQFMDVFNHEADVLVSKLEKRVNQGEFDIYDYITLYALDSICGRFGCFTRLADLAGALSESHSLIAISPQNPSDLHGSADQCARGPKQ